MRKAQVLEFHVAAAGGGRSSPLALGDALDSGGEYVQESRRSGGPLLMFGALAYAVAVIVYVILYGQPVPADPGAGAVLANRVSHYAGRSTLAHVLWTVELVAALLISVAGFVMQAGAQDLTRTSSSRVAWATVGVGAVILSLMYAFMLGGYPSAARAFEAEPGLFAALNGVATFLFNFGSAVVFLGLAGAIASEARSPDVLPRGVAKAGAALALLSAAVGFGMLVDIAALSAAAPLGLFVFLVTAYYGLALWRKGREAMPSATAVDTRANLSMPGSKP